MNRRQVLKLGAVTGGAVALGGVWRLGGRPALAQSGAMPTVDRLHREMPKKLVMPSTGTRVIFGA
jgi:TAT (twin-arginine translocation) pathway signal sequence